MACANVVEGRVLPEFFQRMFADPPHGVQALDILVTDGQAAVGEDQAAGANPPAPYSMGRCHFDNTLILTLTGVMTVTGDADGADAAQPTIVELIQLLDVVADLGHLRHNDGHRRLAFPADFRQPIEPLADGLEVG